ncbi:MAG: hypothetical protein HC872_05045 [Gammaproteobacteria bacterium]|nr:hypothetical protein [Gammaproteobacteria bacterium]
MLAVASVAAVIAMIWYVGGTANRHSRRAQSWEPATAPGRRLTRPAARTSDERDGGAVTSSTAQTTLEQHIITMSNVVSVSATSERYRVATRLPSAPLPVEVEARKQVATAAWKRQVSDMLHICGKGVDRIATTFTARFVPAPRGEDMPEQTIHAEWLVASPASLRALSAKHNLPTLHECLQQARGLPLSVTLSGSAITDPFPEFTEQITLSL